MSTKTDAPPPMRQRSFDWLDMAISLVRAAAGVLAPSLNRPWPGGA